MSLYFYIIWTTSVKWSVILSKCPYYLDRILDSWTGISKSWRILAYEVCSCYSLTVGLDDQRSFQTKTVPWFYDSIIVFVSVFGTLLSKSLPQLLNLLDRRMLFSSFLLFPFFSLFVPQKILCKYSWLF